MKRTRWNGEKGRVRGERGKTFFAFEQFDIKKSFAFFYLIYERKKNIHSYIYIYVTAEKIKGADFTHRIKFVLLVY